jgi:hypothetical protein
MGGAAVLLSNKPSWRRAGRAKYQLAHTVRVHTGAGDASYGCMGWCACLPLHRCARLPLRRIFSFSGFCLAALMLPSFCFC